MIFYGSLNGVKRFHSVFTVVPQNFYTARTPGQYNNSKNRTANRLSHPIGVHE